MKRLLVGAGLLAALAAGFATVPQARAEAQEKCYGVALAGQSDGIGNQTKKARATVNYQGDAWIWVPRGTCLTMVLPVQPDGTPRRGALQPLGRDRP